MSDDRQQTSDEWDALIKSRAIPSLLTREQVEKLLWDVRQCDELGDQMNSLKAHDAALRQALTQQEQELTTWKEAVQVNDQRIDSLDERLEEKAQEVERVKMEVNNRREEIAKLVLETTHTYAVVIPDIVQQLATAQAQCRELEEQVCRHDTAEIIAAGRIRQLQATLAAREAVIEQQEATIRGYRHSIKIIGQQHDDRKAERDAAVQDAERLREQVQQLEQHASGSSGGTANHGTKP